MSRTRQSVFSTRQPDAARPSRAVRTGPIKVPVWQVVTIVFAIAFTLRVVHVLLLSDAPFFTHLLGDAEGYDRWARRLAAGDWMDETSGVFYQAPLYPYVVGSVYALFGRNLLLLLVVQAGLGALACALVSLTTLKWFDARAALFAGLLLAGYAPAVFFDALVQKSVLDGLLVSGLLLTFASSRGEATMKQCVFAGALLGLLTLNRENAIALLPLVALWAWQRAPRRRLAAVSVTVVAVGLVFAPPALRNRLVGGELHLTTSQLGPNFYIGNNSGATGTYVPLRRNRGSFEFERLDATAMAEAAVQRTLRPSEVSAYWLGQGMDWIRNNPGAWLRLSTRKLLLLLNRTEAADTEDVATHAEWSIVLRALAPVAHFGVLGPLGFLGMWITRDRWRALWPAYGFCVIFSLSVVTFYVLDRYRYPLVPVLAVFAGAALSGIARDWRRAGAGGRTGAAAMVATALIVCHWPVLSASDMRALTHYNIGAKLQADGLETPAEAEYRKALEIQPRLAAAHSNLGALLTARGDHQQALEQCQEAVRLDPGFPAAHINLGVVLADIGRTDDAVRAFTEGVRLDPRDAGAHYNLGRALAALGRPDAATEHLREAIRLEPSRAPAYNALGAILCSQGRLEECIALLRTALRLDPSLREASANLAHALALAGSQQ